jgi:hypothetical protein
MTGAFVSRRRAEEFDAMVSAPAPERDTASSQDADLLELVGSLRSMPEVTARPDFVSDLRSQLIVEAARQARPVVDADLRLRLTPRRRSGSRERRAATILGGFAIVAATGSMAVASQSALPGDVLYPVKRAIENAQTNLQSDDAAKAQTLIAHAERRLEEAEQLTAEGASATTVAATLQDFTEQSNQATELALDDYAATGDQEAIDELRSFAGDSMDDLGNLGDVVPTDARPALITAAQSVLQLDSAAFQACPTCGDGAITELPDDFALQSASLDTEDLAGLLSLQNTTESILLPGLINKDKIEDIASQQEDPDQQDDVKAEDPNTPAVDPAVDPSDDPAPANDPIKDLSDKIKDGLGGGNNDDDNNNNGPSDPVDDAVDTVGTVVDGIVGMVDGLTRDGN